METITERLKRDHDERSRDRHDRVTRTVSIVSAIIAGCALLLTSYQIWTIRDNAQRQMRAYVFAKLTTHKYPPQNSDRLGIGFEIKNSGLTWARNLVIRKAKIPRVFNVEYDPWTRAQWDAAGLPMVLGPSQPLELQLIEIWLRDLPDIVDGKTGFDFAVWVTYQDTFTEHRHQTQLVERFAADKDGGTTCGNQYDSSGL